MLSRISSAELVEWAAYASLEPFGPDIENWRSGVVASTIANVNRPKGHKGYRAADFMPGKRRESEKDQMLASLAGMRALAAIGQSRA